MDWLPEDFFEGTKNSSDGSSNGSIFGRSGRQLQNCLSLTISSPGLFPQRAITLKEPRPLREAAAHHLSRLAYRMRFRLHGVALGAS
jgi:hypothetical protein